MIDLSTLPADRPYAVLGLGRSGRAAAQALRAGGHRVWAWDDNLETRESARSESIPIVHLAKRDLAAAAGLVLSPGIPHRYPAPHPVVRQAETSGCPVIGDGELLARAQPHAVCVGITGTNGKSTTTALIGHVLEAAGQRCAVGGNLGTPVLALDMLPPGGIYVLEMSSYQLELTPTLVFAVAILLNITPDHLDRHGGMNGYIAAKRQIFRRQGERATAIVGVDDDICDKIANALAAGSAARIIRISGRAVVPGGVYVRDGTLYDATTDGELRAVLDLAEAAALPGEHNAQNAAAAYAVARALGLDRQAIGAAMGTSPGLSHRQERIAVIDGVAFVNDSKATNADAAARALACYSSVFWIAGGRPKEGGLEALRAYLSRIRHAYLIGEATEGFATWLEGRVAFTRCGTLDHAVAAAAADARAEAGREAGHPVVLLSPACASFDQFTSFEARGEAFRALVEALQ